MYFTDFRPVSFGMMIIASHEIAEQIARSSKFPYGVTKSPTLHNSFHKLIGDQSLLTAEVCVLSVGLVHYDTRGSLCGQHLRHV